MQGIAILMCAMPKTYKVPSAFFLMTVVYLLIYSGLGNSPADVLNHASENHISTILLSYFCLYCINSWFGVIKSSKIFVLWLACFLLVLWSNSRMGLLSFLFMFYLLVVFFVKPRKISSGVIYFFYAIITIILIFICVKLFQEEVQKSLLSEGRIPLWESYLRETLKQPLGWILGTRFLNTSIFIALGYNLHNAFLHMHLIYGITPILVIGIQLLKFFRKKIILLNICAIVLLVRSLTDSIFTGDIATLPLYFFMTVSYMWCERGQMNES